MNDLLRIRLDAQHGAVTTAEVYGCGLDHHGIASLVAAGELVRVREGAYVDAARHGAGSDLDRHVLQARAVSRALGPSYAVSHLSAVAMHGLPVVRDDLGRVQLSRLSTGGSRADTRIRIHRRVPREHVRQVRGSTVVAPALAVVQAAATSGVRAGIVAADAALSRAMAAPADLAAALGVAAIGPGRREARRVVELADARSESAGESWARLVLLQVGLPTPELQVRILDATGGLAGRVDFLFRRQGVIVEFDGMVKYDGADGRAALAAEKRREDRLRRLGYVVVRLTWRDLSDPSRVLALIQEAFAVAASGASRR